METTDWLVRKLVSFCFVTAAGLLTACTQGVMADNEKKWVKFTDANVDSYTVYFDSQSVKTPKDNPGWRQVRALRQDEKEATRSRVIFLTVDCEGQRVRGDGEEDYGELWAQGDMVSSDEGDDEFRDLKFDSKSDDMNAAIDLYRKVCGK